MSNFIKLRLILQQPKPDYKNFLVELQKEEIKKEDLDLLLRKAVESKVTQFRDFCNALVWYYSHNPVKARISTSMTPKVPQGSSRSREQPHACLRKGQLSDGGGTTSVQVNKLESRGFSSAACGILRSRE